METSITPREQAEFEEKGELWNCEEYYKAISGMDEDSLSKVKKKWVPDTVEDGIDILEVTRGVV